MRGQLFIVLSVVFLWSMLLTSSVFAYEGNLGTDFIDYQLSGGKTSNQIQNGDCETVIETFYDGEDTTTVWFPEGGGVNATPKIRVPIGVNVSEARVTLTGLPVYFTGDNEIDTVLVNDVSGSMNDNCGPDGVAQPGETPCKINDMKNASEEFVNYMLQGEDNNVGLVSYSSAVNDVHPLSNDNESLILEIEGYNAMGFTCISCGIQEGIDILSESTNPKKIMLLMSDGEANRCLPGVSCNSPVAKDEARAKAQEAWEDYGIQVYTVAFGEEADETTMQEIAALGNGEYYFAAETNISYVYAIIASELTEVFPTDPALDSGNRNSFQWTYPGSFNTTDMVENGFASDLTDIVDSCACPGCVVDGDECIVDLELSSETAGGIIAESFYLVHKPKYELICDDGLDNDCDGPIDCADSDCNGEIGPGGVVCCLTDDDCTDFTINQIATCDNFPEDDYHYTWDYSPGIPGICVNNICEEPAGADITHTCNDNDLQDSVAFGDGCDAECDEQEDCYSYCDGNVRYYGGECDLGDCFCDYLSEDCSELDYCDEPVIYCDGDEIRTHKLCHYFTCAPEGCEESTEWEDDALVNNCNSYDGNYCFEDDVETRDYTCDASECVYDVTETEDCDSYNNWHGGGDVPSGFGSDPDCIYDDYYCVDDGLSDYCSYEETLNQNFDSMDSDPYCYDPRVGQKDYWCDLSTCDNVEPENGCIYGTTDHVGECSEDCNAECDENGDCSDSYCEETYNDYCTGSKLTEYDSDKVMDSTFVSDTTPNTCDLEGDCTCSDNPVDCSPPETSTYCIEDICGAECDADVDCASYCSDNVRYFGGNCDLTDSCSCSYDSEDCTSQNYCEDPVTYCDGDEIRTHRLCHYFTCAPEGCEESTEWEDDALVNNCNSYDGNYCFEDDVETRDYTCDASECIYDVTETEDCDSYNNWHGGGDVPPEFGSDPDCVYDDYYCVDDGLSDYCDYTETNHNNFDHLDEDPYCYDPRTGTLDYWCDLSTCDGVQPSNGCSAGTTEHVNGCSQDCGAECDEDEDCPDSECSETYDDECVGRRLVDYNGDRQENDLTVTDSEENFCELSDTCECSENPVDCTTDEPDPVCIEGQCNALCDENSDCLPYCSLDDTIYYHGGTCDLESDCDCSYEEQTCSDLDYCDDPVNYCLDDEIRIREYCYYYACGETGCEVVSEGWEDLGLFEDCNLQDGEYCVSDDVETRDYTCDASECIYDVTETEDCDSYNNWHGGGDVPPEFGSDPDCVYDDYYCVDDGLSDYCDYTETNHNNFDHLNEDPYCYDPRTGTFDYWCDLSTCDDVEPSNGCSAGTTEHVNGCSQDCGGECDEDEDCPDSECSETYNDYCSGSKLTEYDSDYMMDSTTVTDSEENFCDLSDTCECSEYEVDCSPPQTSTYCVRGICDAECDSNDDCEPYLEGEYCHYRRPCDTADSCGCQEGEVEYCPMPGTLVGELCYYNERSCTDEGCFIEVCELERNEMCDSDFGCIDMPCIDTDPITTFSTEEESETVEFPLGGSTEDSIKVTIPMNFNATGSTVDLTGLPTTYLGDNEVDLVVVNDVSGSMDDNCGPDGVAQPGETPCKINDLKSATSMLTELLLEPGHNMEGLVSYSTGLVDSTPLTNDEPFLLSEIDEYSASGFTCISCGLQRGLELIQDGSHPTKVIMLMSDGEANRCIPGTACTPIVAKDQAKTIAEDIWETHGVHVYTIAFGEDSDKATMEEIASLGNGSYYYAAETNLTEVYLSIIYEVTTSYPKNPTLDIGKDGIDWSYAGSFEIVDTIQDFHPDINSFTGDECTCFGCTYDSIDDTCTIDFSLYSETAGGILADELRIDGCIYTNPTECYTCEDCGGGNNCMEESQWSEWNCLWDDICDEEADCSREREVTTYTCHNAGMLSSYCSSETSTEGEDYTDIRDTEGNPCGEWKECSEDVCIGLDFYDYPESGQDTCSDGMCQTYSCSPDVYEFSVVCDSDEDGIANTEDECSDTPSEEAVDDRGCSCSQKICDDGNQYTTDSCDEATGECIFEPMEDVPEPIFVTLEEGELVSGEIKLWSLEDTGESDVAYTTFQYSGDGEEWLDIGTDYDGDEYSTEPVEDDYSGGGVPDEFDPSSVKSIELKGWTFDWDTAGLSEGWYHVRVKMVNTDEIAGYEEVMIYIDPTPPVPVLTTVEDEETINGVVELIDTTLDENVETVTWELIPADDYYWKGVPNMSQHDHGEGHGRDGSDIGGVYCAPTSAASSIKYWGTHGYPHLIQHPNGTNMTDSEIVEELAMLMRTNGTRNNDTGITTGGTTKSGIIRGVRYYMENHGGDFIINDTFDPTISDYRRELVAAEEDVLVWLKWYVWNGSGWTRRGAHVVDANSVNNTRNPDNTTGVDFMDPWTGNIVQKNMTDDGWIRWNTYRWAKVWNIITISPNETDEGISVGEDADGTDGWSSVLNTRKYTNGAYFIRTRATDATGFSRSQTILVYIENEACELTDTDLTVSSDSEEYNPGESVSLHGVLRNEYCMPFEGLIAVQVRDSNSAVIYIDETVSSSDGSYESVFTLLSDASLGTYGVYAAYDGHATAMTTFEVIEDEPPPCEGNELTVLTDSEEYYAHDQVTISGILVDEECNPMNEEDIALQVKTPLDNTLFVEQVSTDTKGDYSYQFTLDSDSELGMYTVIANGNGNLAETDFEFVEAPGCEEDWECTDWDPLVCDITGTQTRECTDLNGCGTEDDKPEETQACTCEPLWDCGEWGECLENGTRYRTCTDTWCGLEDITEEESCTYVPPVNEVKVVINEFYSNADTGEEEWIELFNLNNVQIDLDGWTIEDNTASPYSLEGYSILANGYLVLTKGTDQSFGLNNPGDIIILKNGEDEIDKVAYGDNDDGDETDNAPVPEKTESCGRSEDGLDTDVDIDDFVIFGTPTPGEPNVPGGSGEETVEIPLVAGWNLISIPLEQDNWSVAAVLSSIDGKYIEVRQYDALTDTWISYDSEYPEWSELTELDREHGYWINMNTDAVLSVTGTEVDFTEINLYSGWNLIGYPHSYNQEITLALASIEGKYIEVRQYDALTDTWISYDSEYPEWSELTELETGYGYWLNALEDTTLLI